jgi:peptidoglycan/xylan/chitin deacetylase (PgdA/CDA1 family)
VKSSEAAPSAAQRGHIAATWHPQITKQVVDAGMTIGTHTWSHKDLARKPYATDLEQAKKEIEMGFALALAGGAATMVHAADRLPTPVVAADYSGASW